MGLLPFHASAKKGVLLTRIHATPEHCKQVQQLQIPNLVWDLVCLVTK